MGEHMWMCCRLGQGTRLDDEPALPALQAPPAPTSMSEGAWPCQSYICLGCATSQMCTPRAWAKRRSWPMKLDTYSCSIWRGPRALSSSLYGCRVGRGRGRGRGQAERICQRGTPCPCLAPSRLMTFRQRMAWWARTAAQAPGRVGVAALPRMQAPLCGGRAGHPLLRVVCHSRQ